MRELKKVAFVIPWFGWDIPGGAETECRGLAEHFAAASIETEILTTCVEKFASDWEVNYHKPGVSSEHGVLIRRFKADRRPDKASFGRINVKLMNGDLPLPRREEEIFQENMINSRDLYDYIEAHRQEYSAFLFIPYMFGTTYYGVQHCYDNAIMIPCFHEEGYIHMEIFREVFSKVKGMIFLSGPEMQLAQKVFDTSGMHVAALGAGVDTDWEYDADRFRAKYGISEPFLLYAGRKDVGKNINALLGLFGEYKKTHGDPLKLVLIGGGEVEIPAEFAADVMDLGYVDLQDKFDAYAAASVFCQPSRHESFSIVIMESWYCGRPVLVHGGCDVTKNFVIEAGGGLYFEDYFEFERELEALLGDEALADKMGESGRKYVLDNFSWDRIVEKYRTFILECAQG